MSDKKIEDIIQQCRNIADSLEKADPNDPASVHQALTDEKVGLSVCCNACQALSSICVPDSSPNKCKGGCTVTSFAF